MRCGARTEFYYIIIEVKNYLILLFKLVLAYCGFHLFSHFYMSGSNLKHFKLQKNSGGDCRRKTVKMAYICKYDVCNQHCDVVYLFLRLFWHLKKGNLSKHVCRFELYRPVWMFIEHVGCDCNCFAPHPHCVGKGQKGGGGGGELVVGESCRRNPWLKPKIKRPIIPW